MENKYYEPDLSEFYEGFEYELCYNDHAGIWEKEVVEKKWNSTIKRYDLDIPYNSLEQGCLVRVKYLDAEDIDSLGWSRYVHPVFGNVDAWYIGDTKAIFWLGEDCSCSVKEPGDDIIFFGRIKNKSELKRLVQQLKYEL